MENLDELYRLERWVLKFASWTRGSWIGSVLIGLLGLGVLGSEIATARKTGEGTGLALTGALLVGLAVFGVVHDYSWRQVARYLELRALSSEAPRSRDDASS